MQQYLDGLLADLRARHGIFPPAPNLRALAPDPAYPEEVEDSIAYLYGPRYAMSDLFDLAAEAFPPRDRLTAAQAATLAQAIIDLWASLNFAVYLPDGLPLHLAYPLLVKRWQEEPVSVVRDGRVTLEFCHYEPTHCPWPARFCMCQDEWAGSQATDHT